MHEELRSSLEAIFQEMKGGTGVAVYVSYARIIGGIAALYQVLSIYDSLSSGENSFNKLKNFYKVILVALALSFYSPLMGTIDNLFNSIAAGMQQQTTETWSKIERKKELEKIIEKNTEKESSNWKKQKDNAEEAANGKINKGLDEENAKTFNEITNTVAEVTEKGYFQKKIEEILTAIFRTLADLAISALLILRTFFLVVLYTVGPLTIGLSLFPGLKDSFIQWLNHYIGISLWLVIAQILEWVLATVSLNVENNSISIASSGISACAILGFFMVPTMAGMITSAGEAIAEKTTQYAKSNGKKLSNSGKNLYNNAKNRIIGNGGSIEESTTEEAPNKTNKKN